MEQITILIPCYNEKLRLPPTLLIVDDGSKDNTVEEALKFSGKLPLRVVSMPQNMGKWAAIHKGFENVKTDAILLLDADGAASIFELEKVVGLQEILKEKITVFGSRVMSGAEVEGRTLLRNVVSTGYRIFAKACYRYAYAMGASDVDDMQCPWKLVYISKMHGFFFVNQWAGDIELACNVIGRIENLPIRFVHKRGSKVPFTAIFSMAFETMKVAVRVRRQRKAGVLTYT
jgi:glycosyltransferase involved in cell wall biosynthesis